MRYGAPVPFARVIDDPAPTDPYRARLDAEHEQALRRMYETPLLDEARRKLPPPLSVLLLLHQLPRPIERT